MPDIVDAQLYLCKLAGKGQHTGLIIRLLLVNSRLAFRIATKTYRCRRAVNSRKPWPEKVVAQIWIVACNVGNETVAANSGSA